jgi:hypothetical protein
MRFTRQSSLIYMYVRSQLSIIHAQLNSACRSSANTTSVGDIKRAALVLLTINEVNQNDSTFFFYLLISRIHMKQRTQKHTYIPSAMDDVE